MSSSTVRLRLPATSANLGPGFDALGLAMNFHLHVEAELADETTLQITGRNAAEIQNVADNLVLTTCREVLEAAGAVMPPITLRLHNEIPLGMGCGSSAAALVAGVALATHLGKLGWNDRQVLAEASRREGHPDNVAACVLGGFTASAVRGDRVDAISITPPVTWAVLLVLPESGLSTRTARALLPASYSREDSVTNVQNVALLTAAFATGDASILRHAMADRLHQPYRQSVCPLLSALLPLSRRPHTLGVALSGAGPSVLLLCSHSDRKQVEVDVRNVLTASALQGELLWTGIAGPAILGETPTLPEVTNW